VGSSSYPVGDLWVVGDTLANGVLTLTLTGELTFTTVGTARTQLAALLDRSSPPEVQVDLSGVDFCDAAGLRLLLEVTSQAAVAGVTVRVVAASAPVDWLLTLTESASSLGYSQQRSP
jgi:anti-anti-sigma factor